MPEMNRRRALLREQLHGAHQPASRYRWLTANLRLPSHASCLEIGCGNGDLAARIIDGLSPARYVATDLDPQQIQAARRHLARRYANGLPPTLELRTANMLELPFPPVFV